MISKRRITVLILLLMLAEAEASKMSTSDTNLAHLCYRIALNVAGRPVYRPVLAFDRFVSLLLLLALSLFSFVDICGGVLRGVVFQLVLKRFPLVLVLYFSLY